MALSALLLSLAFSSPLAAQVLFCDGYQPKQGENLYDLSARYQGNALLYKTTVEAVNPQINWVARSKVDSRYSDGREIVQIYSTDCLLGLTKTGALIQPVVGTPVRLIPTVVPVPNDSGWVHYFTTGNGPLLGLLLLLLVGTILYLFWKFPAGDPVTSGPAVREGGLTDETAGQHFRERAAVAAGLPRDNIRNFAVERLTRGHAFGVMRTRFGDGTEPLRRFDGTQRVYEAVVRNITTGARTTEYTVMDCANDIRSTGLSRFIPGGEFRFVPGDVIAPEVANAETTPVSAVAEPAAPSAAAIAEESGLAEGEVQIFFQPGVGDAAHQLELKGADTNRHITAKVHPGKGNFQIRFHMPKPACGGLDPAAVPAE